MHVFDTVLADPMAYRQAVLARPFGTVDVGGDVFHGIQLDDDPILPAWIVHRFPQLTPTLSFFRQSPAGQVEPNYVHTDRSMGNWTAILYLNPQPADGDGTTFWRHTATGAIASGDDTSSLDEPIAWRDRAQWEPVEQVDAQFGRVVVFPAARFHSRALLDNYGEGEDARLIQVVFGVGDLDEE